MKTNKICNAYIINILVIILLLFEPRISKKSISMRPTNNTNLTSINKRKHNLGFNYNTNREKLHFHKNHTFRILQITDLHYGDSDEKVLKDTIIQEYLINKARPDIVVVTGDTISGYMWDENNQTFSQDLWKKFSDVFVKTKTKYAYTFGNHDDQGNLKREELHELEKTNPYSYQGRTYDINGVSNYIIPIYSAFNKTDVSTLLWMFDSGSYGCMENKTTEFGHGYGCIEKDQIKWYQENSAKIKKDFNNNVQGLGFFHIELPEYRDMINWGYTYGDVHDFDMGCPNVNSGAFSSMKNQNNIKATFVGHDHNNDFGGDWQGIELAFGRKTGFGSYGPDYKKRGARIIDLEEFINDKGKLDFKYKHYILHYDGTYDYDSTKRRRWQFWNYVKSCSRWDSSEEGKKIAYRHIWKIDEKSKFRLDK